MTTDLEEYSELAARFVRHCSYGLLHFPPRSITLGKFWHMTEDTPFAQQWHIIRFIWSVTVLCNTNLWRSEGPLCIDQSSSVRWETDNISSLRFHFVSFVRVPWIRNQAMRLAPPYNLEKDGYVASRMVYESSIDTRAGSSWQGSCASPTVGKNARKNCWRDAQSCNCAVCTFQHCTRAASVALL
jgi:hypothetical protein